VVGERSTKLILSCSPFGPSTVVPAGTLVMLNSGSPVYASNALQDSGDTPKREAPPDLATRIGG